MATTLLREPIVRRVHRAAATTGLFFLVSVGSTAGCDTLSYYPYDCAELSECPGDNCPGQCVDLPPLGFDGPALLWTGPKEEDPGCPSRAPITVYEGHSGLEATHTCPECTCAPPACVLPDGLMASNTAQCAGPTFTPLDAPAGWTGDCTPAEAVIGSAALGSVTIAPITERGCVPQPASTPARGGPVRWSTYAKACAGEVIPDVCNDPGKTCLPSAAPPPPGFQQCIMLAFPSDGAKLTCPPSYPEKKVIFGDVEDTRECTECTCAQTSPSTCVARISTFQDATCDPTEELFSVLLGEGTSLCQPIQMTSSQLGSMSATWVTNTPGTCQASGGEAIGDVQPSDPRTFCCQLPP